MTTALLLSFLLIQGPVTGAQSAQTSDTVTKAAEVHAGTDGVVRMRKLHLVRPELIPYPLAYDVYC